MCYKQISGQTVSSSQTWSQQKLGFNVMKSPETSLQEPWYVLELAFNNLLFWTIHVAMYKCKFRVG